MRVAPLCNAAGLFSRVEALWLLIGVAFDHFVDLNKMAACTQRDDKCRNYRH
jgi:hypothetical protein